ncbi:MAG: phosphoadenosine phosphosulfate reductase family protein [Oscillospiraceae bacterium]|nr:phosphoadenosine phosphosulfate reductase family protein [Oscillospiraceae bacterium]
MTRVEFAAVIREKYLVNGAGTEGERFETYDALFHTGSKLIEYFSSHNNILISVSGGSDSDCIVHLVCTYFPEYLPKLHFVFVDTGLEFKATKRHLDDLETKYDISIDKIRGISVVTAVRKYGIPILSKEKSEYISGYCRDVPCYVKKVKQTGRFGFSDKQRKLAEYIKQNGIRVSKQCCYYSKKKPLYKYFRENDIDLNVTGERKHEGGQRASSHKSCFEEQKKANKYMPLLWWSDSVKAIFKDAEGISYSDCYEVYGMKRTGCCGCPFNLEIAEDLQAMYFYEPNLYNACMSVFKQSYELTDRFQCRKKKCIPDGIQLRLF